MRFDATGKVSLDHIYTQPDPRAYFRTLRELDYRIPQLAKPVLRRADRRVPGGRGGRRRPTVLDVGCSYGVNAALLRCDVTHGRAVRPLRRRRRPRATAPTLLARDRELVRVARDRDPRPVRRPRHLAARAGLRARAPGSSTTPCTPTWRRAEPTARQRAQLAGADLVISTGCIGYVDRADHLAGSSTRAAGGRPWMAHFVLRMFPFDPIADSLADLGLRDRARRPGVQAAAVRLARGAGAACSTRLSGVGVDPSGLEADGWLYAQLYVSRPRTTPRSRPCQPTRHPR